MNTIREHQSASGRQNTVVRLAVKGQLYEKEDNANYYFPKTDDKQWLEGIPNDPRKDIQLLRFEGNSVESFSLWFNAGKVYYAYRRQLPGRGGSDCAMVVICSDKFISDGTVLVAKMRDVFDYSIRLSSSSEIQDDIIREKLSELSFVPFGIQWAPPTAQQPITTKGNAYRTYSTEDELANIMENPYQSSYGQYDRILIVHKDLLSQTRPGISEVNEKVRQNFFIKNSADSSVVGGKNFIDANESFRLCYRKTGYNDFSTDALRVGLGDSSKKYFTLDNNVIVVKSAAEAGVIFDKDIRVNVKDSSGNPIEKWDCVRGYNDSCKSTSKPGYISLPEEDKKIKCVFSAVGYESVEYPVDVRNTAALSVTLKSKGKKVSVHLSPAWGNPFSKPSSMTPAVEVTCPNGDPFYGKYNGKIEIMRPYTRFFVSKTSPFLVTILTALIALAIGIFVGLKLNSGPEVAGEGNGDPEVALRKDDLGKLNNSPVWKVSDMQSKQYKAFLDSLMTCPEKVGNHKEITNEEWKKFCKVKSDKKQNDELKRRSDLLKGSKARKSIDWKEINMTEEEKDIDYLVKNNVWEVEKVKSKTYKKFLEDLAKAPIRIDEHPELKENKYWSSFIENRKGSIPYSVLIPNMLNINQKLDWTRIDVPQDQGTPTGRKSWTDVEQ